LNLGNNTIIREGDQNEREAAYMELKIEKKDGWLRKPHHIPHNVANAEEMEILLRSMVEKGKVDFDELTRLFFLYQVVHGLFEKFHERPFRCFANAEEPPDFNTLKTTLGTAAKAASFAKKRSASFRQFLQGKLSLDDFMSSPYKAKSSWRRVWSEYTRDYVHFAILLKWVKQEKGNVYKLTDLGKAYLAKPATLKAALLDMEVTSVVMRKKISIHPFKLVLSILDEVKKAGDEPVPSQLLMYLVAHLKGDGQLPLLKKALKRYAKGIRNNDVRIDGSGARKAQRFGLPIRRFLEEAGLAKEATVGGHIVMTITAKGSTLMKGNGKK